MNKIFNFKTILKRPEGVGTWHYVDTPIQVENEFNTKGKVSICGKINGITFKATLIPRGNGEHFIVLRKEVRTETAIDIGDDIELEVWKDNSEKKVTIPNDFKVSLVENQSADEFFETLTYSYKKAYIDWVTSAKKEITRKNRIDKSITFLTEKRKLR